MIGTFVKAIPTPYMLLALALLVGASFVTGYIKGRESGLEEYYDYRATVESEMEVVRLENERKLAAMADVAKHATDGWDAARSALARRPAIRVSDNCSSGNLPAVSAPTEGVEGAAETRTISAAQCEAFLHDGIEDAARLMHLQQWAIDMHEASK